MAVGAGEGCGGNASGVGLGVTTAVGAGAAVGVGVNEASPSSAAEQAVMRIQIRMLAEKLLTARPVRAIIAALAQPKRTG
jgi:hypothetical protein